MRNMWRDSDVTVRLIIVNAVVFLLMRLSDMAAWGGAVRVGWINEWIAMPMNGYVIYRPWTIVTNIFAHYDLVHFFCNMFALYWFGRLFAGIFGSARLLVRAYFLGGVAGSLFALVFALLMGFGNNAILLGASGAIVGLLVAVAVAEPRRRIWMAFVGNVELRWVAIVTLLIFVVLLVGMNNVGGNLAHLGGGLMGYVIAKYADKIDSFSLPGGRGGRSRMRVSGGYNKDWEYNARQVDKEKEVNRLLDKIRERGYNSLTEEEKRALFDLSGKK